MKLFRFVLASLLALCLVVMPVVSSANAGSTTAPTPTKSLPKDFKFPPVGEIAKRLAGRANVVNYAVESLLGAVDWVLDPANNQAKIKFPTPTSVCRGSYLHYKWIGTADYVAESYCKVINHTHSKHIFGEWNRRASTTYSRAVCESGYGGSTFVDCGLPVEETSIPLNVIAEQIIQNAQAGHVESVDFVQAVANELNKQTGAKPIASANTNEDTDTSNPDKEKDDKEPNQCKPCEPYPVGTIGYQGPETDKAPIPQLYEKRQHYHMFKVNQIPKRCECKWNHNNDFNHQYTGPIHYKWINLNSSPRRPPAYPH